MIFILSKIIAALPGNHFSLHKTIAGLFGITSQPSGNQNCLSGNHIMVPENRVGEINSIDMRGGR